MADEFQLWLEAKQIKFEPLVGGPSGQHTDASVVESGNRIVRELLHRLMTAAKDLGVNSTPEELLDEAQYICNNSSQHGGIAPYQSALSLFPDDPLDSSSALTTTQLEDPEERFVEKVRLRVIGKAAFQEALLKERINRVERHQARRAGEQDAKDGFGAGNVVDIFQTPTHKDASSL